MAGGYPARRVASYPEVLSLTGQALGVKALAARYGVDVSS